MKINKQIETVLLGYAEVDITPNHPVEMVGFGRLDETSKGIQSHLYAQVMLWNYQEDVCCLITIDHIGFSKHNISVLRKKISHRFGFAEEKIMLCFSHTHGGPNDSLEEEWSLDVHYQICQAIHQAQTEWTPVYGGWANAYSDIGLNRRKDSNFLDRRIGIFKVQDTEKHHNKLILLRVTAHANVLKADNYFISSDYFGAVRETLSQKYKCPVVLIQGAAGNVAPRYFCSQLNPPDACDDRFIRSETALQDMANEILTCVKPMIAQISVQPIQQIGMYTRSILLHSDVPSLKEAQSVAQEAQQYAGIDGRYWLEEVQRLNNAHIHYQSEMIEVQYFYLNEGCLSGVANEVMCEFALECMQKLHNEYFYFNGYTNGCLGYFPTEEEFDQGGYEVYWSMLIFYIYQGRVYPLQRDSATQLIHFVIKNA